MEKIVVVSGVNETGLLRTMSWHGHDSFGTRVMDAAQLAQYALVRSGKMLREKPVDMQARRLLMLRVLESLPGTGFSSDYSDVGKLLDALDRLRTLVPSDEAGELRSRLAKGEFTDKNSGLIKVYDAYMKLCAEEGVMDRISVFRYAAENCGTLENFQLMTLKERPLTPLEARLTAALGGSGETSLTELYGARTLPRKAEVSAFRAYGASNEALHVIEKILSEKDFTFDSCVVAAADTKLTPAIFLELGQRFGINMTFGCGVPISCTTAADMLVRLRDWAASGYGASALSELVNSRAFNTSKLRKLIAKSCGIKADEVKLKQALSIAGKLRLGCGPDVNRERMDNCDDPLVEDDKRKEYDAAFAQARVIAEELGKGMVYLLRKYCVRRGEYSSLDGGAVNRAASEMSAYSAVTGNPPEDVIPELLTRNVGHSLPRHDALHITSAEQAVFSLRDRLFVTGLSAANFPGTPAEDPLTLDSDLKLFEDLGAAELPASDRIVIRRKKQAVELAEAASRLCREITLSYSYFDSAELKRANMSTALHEMYTAASGGSETYEELLEEMPSVSYFEDGMTADRLIGRGYCRNRICKPDEKHWENSETDCFDREKEYSPSAVGGFFECPKKYFLQRVLGIPDEDSSSDFKVTEANEFGLMLHELMNMLAVSRRSMSRDRFEKKASEMFDRFLTSKVPLIADMAAPAKREFMTVAMNTYDMDTALGTAIIEAEQEYSAEHVSGLKLKGRLDRLEEAGGSFVIGDFKSGRRIKQKDEDVHTWLQTMLYAYMVDSTCAEKGDPRRTSRCEYRYPRAGIVSKDYDETIPERIITEFTEHLVRGDFPCYDDAAAAGIAVKNEDECLYCSYKGMCGKEEQS